MNTELMGGVTAYDADIDLAAGNYGFNASTIKSLLWTESRLNPNAKSAAGAQGIAQFMPATWRDVEAAKGVNANPYDPKAAIDFSGFYLKSMYSRLSGVVSDSGERLKLALASYNAGPGSVDNAIKASGKGGGAVTWQDVDDFLPRETQDYVNSITALDGELSNAKGSTLDDKYNDFMDSVGVILDNFSIVNPLGPIGGKKAADNWADLDRVGQSLKDAPLIILIWGALGVMAFFILKQTVTSKAGQGLGGVGKTITGGFDDLGHLFNIGFKTIRGAVK